MSKKHPASDAASGEVNEQKNRTSPPGPDSAAAAAQLEEFPPTTKTKKKRAETQCVVEKQAMVPDKSDAANEVPRAIPIGDGVYDTLNSEPCEDLADGYKKAALYPGGTKFRVVRILAVKEVKVETVSKATIV